jgi:hypothetical protein
LARQRVFDIRQAVSGKFDQQGEEQQAKDGQVSTYGQDFDADREALQVNKIPGKDSAQETWFRRFRSIHKDILFAVPNYTIFVIPQPSGIKVFSSTPSAFLRRCFFFYSQTKIPTSRHTKVLARIKLSANQTGRPRYQPQPDPVLLQGGGTGVGHVPSEI